MPTWRETTPHRVGSKTGESSDEIRFKAPASTLLPGIVAAALLVAPARADVITDWNVTTNALVAKDVGNNPKLRTLAMVHVAMSDAINTVQNRYTRVVATLPAALGASAEAAAATAARQILTQIDPEQKAKIEETYAASLKAIPDGPAKTEGIKLGMEVAEAVQSDRANDGTNAPDTYRPHTTPGAYVTTTPPLWEQYARAKPWVLKSADQFRPGPPPALSSAEWARDYNEVKSLGGTKSTARTPEQTEAVTFWENVNFGLAWQAGARELSIKEELPLAECARLFALLNMSLLNEVGAEDELRVIRQQLTRLVFRAQPLPQRQVAPKSRSARRRAAPSPS